MNTERVMAIFLYMVFARHVKRYIGQKTKDTYFLHDKNQGGTYGRFDIFTKNGYDLKKKWFIASKFFDKKTDGGEEF